MIDKRLAHSHGVIDVVKTVDHAAGIVGDSFNMKNFHHASIILNFGAITGDAVLKVFSGATVAAVCGGVAINSLADGASPTSSGEAKNTAFKTGPPCAVAAIVGFGIAATGAWVLWGPE